MHMPGVFNLDASSLRLLSTYRWLLT